MRWRRADQSCVRKTETQRGKKSTKAMRKERWMLHLHGAEFEKAMRDELEKGTEL